ncbi:MAG: TIGR04086 family membrane protein [Clostridia bacterium]|nr:TIGR04086 family membrane protein [Clostridia bacterium]
MPEKRRTKPQTGRSIRIEVVRVLIGSLTGIAVYFVLTAVASLILWKADTDESLYKFIMLLVGAAAAFAGGFAAVRPVRKNGIIVGALSVLPVYAVELVVSLLVSKSGIGIIGWILLAIQLTVAAVGGIIAVNKRK